MFEWAICNLNVPIGHMENALPTFFFFLFFLTIDEELQQKLGDGWNTGKTTARELLDSSRKPGMPWETVGQQGGYLYSHNNVRQEI